MATTTPYSFSSISRLQRGLMSTDPWQPGDNLTEEETIQAVSILLKLDATMEPGDGVGRATRELKANANVARRHNDKR